MKAEQIEKPLSDWNVRRIFLLGDSHGDTGFMKFAIAAAARNGCDVLLQLGDFGYWDHTLGGREYLDKVSRTAIECEMPVLFVDGNHENHDMLRDLMFEESSRFDGLVWVRPYVGWLTRGALWEWESVLFGAAGGAASVDRSMRSQGWTWWSDEVLVRSDVAALSREKLDVLVCHDAPDRANMFSTRSFPKEDLKRAHESRLVLDSLIESSKPSLVIHGHWHKRHTVNDGDLTIEGFADNEGRFEKAAGILSLPTLTVSKVGEDGNEVDQDADSYTVI